MRDIWRIIKFTGELRRYYLAVGFFTVLLAVMSQLQPLFTKGAIDQVSKLAAGGHANVRLVALFAALIFLTDVAQTLLSNVGGFIGDILSAKLQRLMSQRYYEHVINLPQGYFDNELSGKIINRMSRGISQIAAYVQTVSNNFLQFLFSTILSLGIVAYFSWQTALILLALYPVFIWLTTRSSATWQNYQQTINEEQDIATGRFAEAVNQIRVVKSFLQEARELKFFQGRYDKVVATTYPQSKFWHRQDNKRRLVLNVIFFLVFIFIFVEAAHGVYSVGTMVLLVQYAMLIRIPIFTISFLVDQTQRAIANTRDYFEVMDVPLEVADQPEAGKLSVQRGAIAFNHLRFGYDAKSPVLKDLDFRIHADTKVALVGESGEGKTTISNLLLRLYGPQGGSITIDGQDIGQVTHRSLRANIAVVFQEPALFSGTVRENIAYAKPNATDAQIVAAAKAANAHEFVSKFPKAYDTEIGERGLRLSGGQKQRIAIARALLKDAPILILDEATSSLDSKSERLVQQALERLMKGRTTLIIAHRLSTIQTVDQIVSIRSGRVSEIGSPAELAKSGGIYAELLKLQAGHTEANKKRLQAYEISN